jgi:hypothetical protein
VDGAARAADVVEQVASSASPAGKLDAYAAPGKAGR